MHLLKRALDEKLAKVPSVKDVKLKGSKKPSVEDDKLNIREIAVCEKTFIYLVRTDTKSANKIKVKQSGFVEGDVVYLQRSRHK